MKNRLGTCTVFVVGMLLVFSEIYFLRHDNIVATFTLLMVYGVAAWVIRGRKLLNADVIVFSIGVSSLVVPCLHRWMIPLKMVFPMQATLMVTCFVVELIRWNYWIESEQTSHSGSNPFLETSTPGA